MGFNRTQISKIFGISRKWMYDHVDRKPKNNRKYGQRIPESVVAEAIRLEHGTDLTREEIARKLAVSRRWLWERLGHRWCTVKDRPTWRPKKSLVQYNSIDPLDRALILVLVALKFTFDETAEAVGKTSGQVSGTWYRHRKGLDYLARQGIELRREEGD